MDDPRLRQEEPTEADLGGYLNDQMTARFDDARYRTPGPTTVHRGIEPNTSLDLRQPLVVPPADGLPVDLIDPTGARSRPDSAGETMPRCEMGSGEEDPHGRA